MGIALLGLTQPMPPTVWSSEPGSDRAQCSSANDANVLEITAVGGAKTPKPSPTPSGPASARREHRTRERDLDRQIRGRSVRRKRRVALATAPTARAPRTESRRRPYRSMNDRGATIGGGDAYTDNVLESRGVCPGQAAVALARRRSRFRGLSGRGGAGERRAVRLRDDPRRRRGRRVRRGGGSARAGGDGRQRRRSDVDRRHARWHERLRRRQQ